MVSFVEPEFPRISHISELYGLSGWAIVKIRPRKACIYPNWYKLYGFRMIRLAFYIRDSREIDRGHVSRISEAILGSGGIEKKATSLLRLRNFVLSEDLLKWQTCRGHYVSPPNNTLTDLPGASYLN